MTNKNLLKIEDVYFAYTCIAEPTFKFEPKIEKEFKTTVILSEDQSDDFKKLKLNKTVKEILTSEFEAKYKFAPPYPDQKRQYLIGVSKRATYKDGNPTPEFTYPKAVYKKDEGSEFVDITTTNIGNGSFGDIRLEPSYSEKARSTNISLHSVLIRDLVPYEKKGDEWATSGSNVRSGSPNTPPAITENDDLPF